MTEPAPRKIVLIAGSSRIADAYAFDQLFWKKTNRGWLTESNIPVTYAEFPEDLMGVKSIEIRFLDGWERSGCADYANMLINSEYATKGEL